MYQISNLERQIHDIYKKLQDRKITVDNLSNYQNIMENYFNALRIQYEDTNTRKNISFDILHDALMICLDYYSFSSTGSVLITDRQYDVMHNLYMELGGAQIIYPDPLENRWKMVKHKRPYMVGSVKKSYTKKDIDKYIDDLCNTNRIHLKDIEWIISPKYDGISACLEFHHGKLVQALTRGNSEIDGRVGQDITLMVKNCENIHLLEEGFQDGFLKVELLCSTEAFKSLSSIYKNRRSATSAIVNSPKNADYGIHIHAMPLLFDTMDHQMSYIPPYSSTVKNMTYTDDIMDKLKSKLDVIRDNSFPYRVDGVILYPKNLPSMSDDVMANSMAYKINTNINKTRIEYGYVSVGKAGKATPMLHLEPCEINETTVQDVSLGSFQIYEEMNLHENETIMVYSAGDVIPQMKLPSPREFTSNKLLHIPKVCPYCNKRLDSDYYCRNAECPRLKTGKISNFLEKLGVENLSDGTIELLRKHHLVNSIIDLFKLNEDAISEIPGFGDVSARNIVTSIKELQQKPIQYAQFFGALNVPNASIRTFEKILDVIPAEEFIHEMNKLSEKGYSNMTSDILDIPGIGIEKRNSILNYMADNWYEISQIMKHMTLASGYACIGEVVFTGFRDSVYAEKFLKLGIRPSPTITSKTVAVIAKNKNTGKAKTAIERNIPLFMQSEMNEALEFCTREILSDER